MYIYVCIHDSIDCFPRTVEAKFPDAPRIDQRSERFGPAPWESVNVNGTGTEKPWEHEKIMGKPTGKP